MPPNYRRCVSCRRVAPRQQFWRVVRSSADGTTAVDWGMGRSAYLCPQVGCLRLAQKKNRLGRALKVQVPDSVWVTLWQRLEASTVGQTQLEEGQVAQMHGKTTV
ncbi:MAG: YlxR family protein [Leptolyngbyaceae cyanobacterium SM2_5_2]|nr:YlxR family protein [Leptolyngbyaceae cyanobacterium SM2_5_2]